MSCFVFTKYTNLNTIFIAGLLCHIAIFLFHAKDNTFFNPLTSIHYNPSALLETFLPTISTTIEPLTIEMNQNVSPSKAHPHYSSHSTPTHNTRSKRVLHALGDPLERSDILPTGIRNISAISVALLRVIIHSIFTYTLQTLNRGCPSNITQLVECTEPRTCSKYFFLHLIQDIRDVTSITNTTFEEAVLIVHILIDRLFTIIPDKHNSALPVLQTECDLIRWEEMFEDTFVSKLDVFNNDNVLREKMLTIFNQSKDCDTKLLRIFFEEEGKDFSSKLWRHRNIISYDHLLQVFTCQNLYESKKYPILEKFLKEQPLLAATKYIPEFVKLLKNLTHMRTAVSNNNKKVQDMFISDFIQFILEEKRDSYNDYINHLTSLTITCTQLLEERHIIDAYYPGMGVIHYITNNNTRIGQLLSTSHQKGILTSLINLLVNIHNSFISKYTESYPESRPERSIPLSLVTPHQLINYTDQLDNLILSNATHSFRVGEGRLVKYDFIGIQREFCDRFMFNKPSIENDLDLGLTELTQLRLFDNLKLIQINIQQEEVSEYIWNSIKAELNGSADISGIISLIELVISFVSFGKQKSLQTITQYMHEVLKYPNNKCLIGPDVDDQCYPKHLLSLWQKLSVFRAKLLPRFYKFSHLPNCYSTELDTSQCKTLKNGLETKYINDILDLLYCFIKFNLHSQTEVATPPTHNENLQRSLCEFSKWNLILPQDDQYIKIVIPESFLVCHTVSTWNILIEYSKQMQA
ncbi:E3 ubiquitin-protein ligase [Oopsacas minuta]|uniref:E3 ubiquitin-protein ligase n=1 Tax=Oopsacas minuta TaxID=111878 RepID=A0AAV7JS11_9METZ|nr:E3 ubiquitin-protein ligase [Oopsacas minuta]